MSQPELAKETRWTQPAVSGLEKGIKKFPPVRVLIYLQSHGINMNALFDESISVDEFVRISRYKSLVPIPQPGECSKCIEKERTISAMNKTIETMEDSLKDKSVRIASLEHQAEIAKETTPVNLRASGM